MTATNENAAKVQTAQEEKRDGFSVETGKVIQGISLVFSGVVTMLEALHPRVSLEPSAVLHLITGNVDGLAAMVAEKRAQQEAESSTREDNNNADEATGDGAADAVSSDTAPVPSDDVPAKVETPATAATISSDDITKIIVRKIKQNRENSKKIEQILKTYGVSKVSELPFEKYEAFVTDLSAI